MDTEYLQCMVGEALALGLAEVAMKKPADPIDYLGCWLLRYKVNSKTASKSKAADEMLSREIADARQQEEQRKRLAEEESRLLKNERSEEIVDIRIHRELDDVTRPGERKGEAKPAEENDVEATGSQSEMKIESDTRTEAVSDNNSPITDEEKAALAAASAAQ